MYVFNNFIIRTRGDQTSLTLHGGLCVDRTVCAELSLAHFSSLIPVPNDVIKFSEGWLSAYHVPSNTRALGTWKHLVGVALFTRGLQPSGGTKKPTRSQVLCELIKECSKTGVPGRKVGSSTCFLYILIQNSLSSRIRWAASFDWECQGSGPACGEVLLEQSLSNKQRFAKYVKGERAAQAKETTQVNLRKTSYDVR